MMKKISPLLVMLAGTLWGTMGLFVRTFYDAGLGALEISEIRAAFTSVILLCVLGIFNRKLLSVRLKDLWIFLGTGICSVMFFNYCYFRTISLTSLSVAAVLLYTAPAMVMVISLFVFKEKLTKEKVIALVLSFVGCVFVTGLIGGSLVLNVPGILIGLGAGFGYSLYTIFSRIALEKGYPPFTITAFTFLFTSIGNLFVCDVKAVADVMTADGTMLLYGIVFAVVSTVLPYLLYTTGLSYMEAGKASIMSSAEPVSATILGILVLGDPVTVSGILGVVCILSAIVILNIKKPEAEKEA
ncbi:MAG: DMT family transporter [Lachnospiraceae bacterium]|jgi:DME family drug/metabolite transporter